MTGVAVEGTWFDRTLEYNARLRGKELEKGESASTQTIRLSPLHFWKHLTEEKYRAPASRSSCGRSMRPRRSKSPAPGGLEYCRILLWALRSDLNIDRLSARLRNRLA